MDDVYQILRSRILKEVLYPGQKISEISLAEEFNCSRTPIRDVLKRLELDGLITIKPKSGTYVKAETPKDMVETMQIRASLERLAFTLACTNASARDIARLKKLKKDMDRLTNQDPIDMMKFAQLHYDFHYQIIACSGNDLLPLFFERLNLRSSHMFYQMMDSKLAGETQDEHRMIVEYLEKRSPEGGDFIEDHLKRKIDRVLSNI